MSRYPTRRAAREDERRSEIAKRARSQSPERAIKCLPNELLAMVFHTLPWWDRLKLEAVCHRWRKVVKQGWNDVGGFTLDPNRSAAADEAALAQCGNQVESLNVRVADEHLLRLCPNVRHLRLVDVELTQPMGDAMRELYAPKIKSLSLDKVGFGWRDDGVRALNAFLDAANANLEFLRVNCIRIWDDFHFTDQLRCLQLRAYQSSCRFLSRLNDGRRFLRLRSLELSSVDDNDVAKLSALRNVPELEHLELGICHTVYDETALIDTLSSLTLHNLKSAVIRGGSPRLLKELPDVWPELEHLGWTFSSHSSTAGPWQVSGLANLPALADLRSLQIAGLSQEIGNWEWLEELVESGQLEHLDLSSRPPEDLIYKAIQKCQRLHTICADGKYSAEKLAAAASEAGKAYNKGAPLPIIYCYLDAVRPAGTKGCGRVRFVVWTAPKSHVLRHYRYGCLSDGKPKWKKMR